MARVDELTWAAATAMAEGAKLALGDMIAGLRDWDLFGTMTYDQRRYPTERVRVRRAWACEC